MRWRRPYRVRAVWALLPALLATTLVPRDAWYEHRHAADTHGHVHAWAAPSGEDAWWEELLAESVAHEHRHHAHDEHGHEPGEAHAHARDDVRTFPTAGDAAPRLAVAPSGTAAHAHWQAPFQVAAEPAAPSLPFVALAVARVASAAAEPAPARRAALRARGPPALPSV